MRILILDDQSCYLESLTDILSDPNLIMDATTDPEHALELLQTPDLEYSLVILDVNMPKYSGFDIAKKIDTMGLRYLPPIIFLTAVRFLTLLTLCIFLLLQNYSFLFGN